MSIQHRYSLLFYLNIWNIIRITIAAYNQQWVNIEFKNNNDKRSEKWENELEWRITWLEDVKVKSKYGPLDY